ncbi:MAG: amidinotransferase [Bacteroidetes bacterium]|nr:amidinotransferase [Bacteroidota bacterium]
MVRPAAFGYNAQTALTNSFQSELALASEEIQRNALAEFDAMVDLLRAKGVEVHVFHDTPTPPKPDAIFPNNWVSLHADGKLILYPMCTINRRWERRVEIIEEFKQKFSIQEVIDLSHYESDNRFLEGTGSIIFDHVHQVAYACLSPRTDRELFVEVCKLLNYEPIYFHSVNEKGQTIYHTNVMMAMGDEYVVICLDSIQDKQERKSVEEKLVQTHHKIISISLDQVNHFAGNMLQLQTTSGNKILVMSQRAYQSLSQLQIDKLGKYVELVSIAIPTIETIGGGSVRCMMGEGVIKHVEVNYK